ncbi:MAG: aldo/keto reductase [Acidimicrobiia bacterium]|nr:aldo/keto reductase [Acidimicrobiia bacterium]
MTPTSPPPSLVDPAPRSLGPLGEIGPLGFGCWRFTHDDIGRAGALLDAALDAGMTLVDTADVYGLDWGGTGFGSVESLLGAVLADDPTRRDRMVLATKGGIRPPVPYDSSAAWLRTACEDSLRRLQVDHVELYQIHRADLFTHPAEVADTLADLIERELIEAVGVSNHTPAQHRALAAHLEVRGVPLVSTQPEYSAAVLDPLRDGTFDLAAEADLVPLVWSPLAGGRLATGDGISPNLVEVLDDLAAREDVDRATVALAFALAHPARPVALVGSQRPERLTAAVEALSVHLDRSDVYRIVVASEGVPLP